MLEMKLILFIPLLWEEGNALREYVFMLALKIGTIGGYGQFIFCRSSVRNSSEARS